MSSSLVLNPSVDLCPCGSGRTIKNCCLWKGELFRRASRTRPPRPKTGLGHPKCFARDLLDCSSAISREHYVSAALLREIGGQSGTVEARGMRWLGSGSQILPVDAFVANTLCVRHNTALSPLDLSATRFCKLIRRLHPESPDSTPDRPDVCVGIINGHDLERWCVKVLIGLCVSGNLVAKAGHQDSSSPEYHLVKFLFGESAYLPFARFYVTNPTRSLPSHSLHVSVTLLSTEDGEVAGLSVLLAGLEFALVGATSDYPPSKHGMNRPAELVVSTRHGHRRIVLSWERGGSGQLALLEQRTQT